MVHRHKGWNVRRRFKRYATPEVSGRIEASTAARVVDISVKGLAVETPLQLKIGRLYVFHLGRDEHQISVEGKVRWCQLRGTRRNTEGDTETVYHSGVAIADMLSSRALQLIDFIERFADVAPGERMFARIRPEGEADASIAATVGVRVRQISRSGMLVESELALEPGSLCEVALKLGAEVFRSLARVVHLDLVQDAPPEGRHRIGLELCDTAREERARLDRFIRRELVARGVGTRVQPRRAAPDRTQRENATPAMGEQPAAEIAPQAAAYRGNPQRKIFHCQGCRSYGSRGCSLEFATREQAIAAGLRPCKLCRP